MYGLLKKTVEKVFGNGQPGLSITVPELSVKIDMLAEKIGGLSTNVSALMTFMSEDIGETRGVEKRKISARGWAAIIASSILGLAAIIVTIILKT